MGTANSETMSDVFEYPMRSITKIEEIECPWAGSAKKKTEKLEKKLETQWKKLAEKMENLTEEQTSAFECKYDIDREDVLEWL